jgi:HEAT repeat protein
MRQQDDSFYAEPLMKTLREQEPRFTSNGFGSGLETLAHVYRKQRNQTEVREFLLQYVNHPKTTVRTRAISALGTLGDPKAISVLESFANSPHEPVANAARRATATLRESKPTAPKELIELRKEMAEFRKANEKLQAEMKELKDQLEAKQ